MSNRDISSKIAAGAPDVIDLGFDGKYPTLMPWI